MLTGSLFKQTKMSIFNTEFAIQLLASLGIIPFDICEPGTCRKWQVVDSRFD